MRRLVTGVALVAVSLTDGGEPVVAQDMQQEAAASKHCCGTRSGDSPFPFTGAIDRLTFDLDPAPKDAASR